MKAKGSETQGSGYVQILVCQLIMK